MDKYTLDETPLTTNGIVITYNESNVLNDSAITEEQSVSSEGEVKYDQVEILKSVPLSDYPKLGPEEVDEQEYEYIMSNAISRGINNFLICILSESQYIPLSYYLEKHSNEETNICVTLDTERFTEHNFRVINDNFLVIFYNY